MKNIFLLGVYLAMMAIGVSARAQTQWDTLPLTARQWNYYYTEWYDQCERYENNGFYDSCFVEKYVASQWVDNIGK